MKSLQAIFRRMLAVWLILVIVLVFVVSRNTKTRSRVVTTAPRTSEHETPLRTESRPAQPEWTALPVGRTTAGSGTFGTPEIKELPDGSVEVVLPLTGTHGSVSYYNPTNVSGATVDFMGKWNKPPYMKHNVKSGCLSLVQMASHDGYFRVSGVAADRVGRVKVKAEYSRKNNAVRAVFSPAGSGKD